MACTSRDCPYRRWVEASVAFRRQVHKLFIASSIFHHQLDSNLTGLVPMMNTSRLLESHHHPGARFLYHVFFTSNLVAVPLMSPGPWHLLLNNTCTMRCWSSRQRLRQSQSHRGTIFSTSLHPSSVQLIARPHQECPVTVACSQSGSNLKIVRVDLKLTSTPQTPTLITFPLSGINKKPHH